MEPTSSIRMINLGCGHRFHPEWVNVDIAPSDLSVLRCDLSCSLPFADASFDVVYHSNVLEHIRPGQVRTFIGECYRILKPGGVLRVAVPDLEQICRLYLQKLEGAVANEPNAAAEYDWIMVELLDQCVRERSGGEMLNYLRRQPLAAGDFVIKRIGNEGRDMLSQIQSEAKASTIRSSHFSVRARLRTIRLWLAERLLGRESMCALQIGQFRMAGEVHQWMYDRYSLARLLTSAGFAAPQLASPGTSGIHGWDQFYLEAAPDGTVHKPDSLVMEFVKPL